MAADRLENIVSLAKRRGFVFPSSEIYGPTILLCFGLTYIVYNKFTYGGKVEDK